MASTPVLQTMKAQDHPVIVPELSRHSSAPSVHEELVGCQRGGSTSVSLCDLVSLGTDESDPPVGTENPRVGSSILPLAISPNSLPHHHIALVSPNPSEGPARGCDLNVQVLPRSPILASESGPDERRPPGICPQRKPRRKTAKRKRSQATHGAADRRVRGAV